MRLNKMHGLWCGCWRRWVCSGVVVGAAGCDDDEGGEGGTVTVDTSGSSDTGADTSGGADVPKVCDAQAVVVTGAGVTLSTPCGDATVTLKPSVRVQGQWRGAGRDGACAISDGGQALRRGAGDAGTVILQATERGEWFVSVQAAREVVVEGLSLEGVAAVEGAQGWLSQGFQSWSGSGVVTLLQDAPSDADIKALLETRADEEVVRDGQHMSWWYTYIGGAGAAGTARTIDAGQGPALFAGVTAVARWKSWVTASGQADEIALRLGCGMAGEAVTVAAGSTAQSEPWMVWVGDDLTGALKGHGGRIASRRAQSVRRAEAGWNSWYDLWDGVDAQAVKDNSAAVATLLDGKLPEGTPPLRIVVDDGWQVAWGEWTPNEKFPAGLDGLATELKAQGFEVGVWFAPLLVDEDSALVTDHPEWFVEGAVYQHLKNGPMRVLDVTHPEAAAHLKAFVGQIVGWGFDFIKIDFLFAGAFEGARQDDVTGMEAYVTALSLIREAAGEDATILAVGAPGIPDFPYVDAWRVRSDIAVEPVGPHWAYVVEQARAVGARWWMCEATLCDADPPLLRVLPQGEVQAGAWVVALAGGAQSSFSDDLRTLDASGCRRRRPRAGRAVAWWGGCVPAGSVPDP